MHVFKSYQFDMEQKVSSVCVVLPTSIVQNLQINANNSQTYASCFIAAAPDCHQPWGLTITLFMPSFLEVPDTEATPLSLWLTGAAALPPSLWLVDTEPTPPPLELTNTGYTSFCGMECSSQHNFIGFPMNKALRNTISSNSASHANHKLWSCNIYYCPPIIHQNHFNHYLFSVLLFYVCNELLYRNDCSVYRMKQTGLVKMFQRHHLLHQEMCWQ